MVTIDDVIKSHGTPKFWQVARKFCDELPSAELTISDIMEIVNKTIPLLKRGDLPHNLFTGIQKWVGQNSETGILLIEELLKSQNEEYSDFITWSIIGLCETESKATGFNLLEGLFRDKNPWVRASGIKAAGMIRYGDADYEVKFLENLDSVITKALATKAQHELTQAIDVSGRLYSHLPNAEKLLIAASSFQEPEAQFAVTSCLWVHINYADHPEVFRTVFLNQAKVNHQDSRIVQTVNSILSDLLEADVDLVLEYLNEWLITKDDSESISVFEHLFSELYRRNRKKFQETITNWFNADDSNFHQGAASVLQDLRVFSIYDVELDADILSTLEVKDLYFIANKVMGYVFGKEHQQSLLFSLLYGKPKNKDVELLVVMAFRGNVFYNYPSTKEYLLTKKSTETPFNKKVIERIIKESEAYFKEIEDLPHLKEFWKCR